MSSDLFTNSTLHRARLSLLHGPPPPSPDHEGSFPHRGERPSTSSSEGGANGRPEFSEGEPGHEGVDGDKEEYEESKDDDMTKDGREDEYENEKEELGSVSHGVDEEKADDTTRRRMSTIESINSTQSRAQQQSQQRQTTKASTRSKTSTKAPSSKKSKSSPGTITQDEKTGLSDNHGLPFSLSDLPPGTTISSAPHIPPPSNPNGSHDTDSEKGNIGVDDDGKEWFALVDFEKEYDRENPRQWTMGKKWRSTGIVSAFVFISPISSSMIAPCTQQLVEKFGIHSTVVSQMVTSVFVLAYAFGPLLLGPMSELFGRSRVLQLANLFYLVFNFVGGFAKNTGQMIAFRFLAGLGGSAPLSIGGGFISDLFAPNERGRALGVYALGPMMGPVLGPLIGSWIAEKTTYKWVFWCTSILTAVVQGLGVIFLRESYAPTLLANRAARLRKTLGLPKGSPLIRTVYDKPERHWQVLMVRSLIRPFRLLLEPIVLVLGTYMAFIYGVIYLVLTTVYEIFVVQYNESPGIAGLNYIGLGFGFVLATYMVSKFVDIIYKYLAAKNDGKGQPEFRLPIMIPGTFALPAGLLMFGWGAQEKVHWMLPDVGLALIALGMFSNFGGIQNYVIDTFGLYAASGLAAVSFLRSLCGFGFPLFAPTMYDSLGYGKANTILAAAAIVIGCPAPWIFYIYGPRIRSLSKYARKGHSL